MTNRSSSLTGYAIVLDSTKPNYLQVNLPIKLKDFTLFWSKGSYQVWDTDYTSYALVYSCSQLIPGLLRTDTVWMLSRTKTLSDATVNKLNQTMINVGVKTVNFDKTQQVCNN
jgi:lipocalin